MPRLSKSVALWLPLANLVFAAAVLVVPAILFFIRVKHAAHGADAVVVRGGEFQFVLRSNEFLSQGFISASHFARKWVVPLNAPGILGDLLLSMLSERTGRWYPGALSVVAWQSVMYPIFAMPAWIYAARGFHILRTHSSVGTAGMIASCFLTVVSLTISCGLLLGLSPSERQYNANYLIIGFAPWSFLFVTRFIAWLQRPCKIAPAAV